MPPVFAVRQKVHALLHGVYQVALIEQVEADPTHAGNDQYYVHWLEYDRRMDQWLPADAIRAAASSSTKKGGQSKGSTGRTMTTRLTAASSTDTIEEVQQQAPPKGGSGNAPQRQGRPDSSFFCRPKNIQTVVMGPHEMDAWYFSPYHIARPAVRQAKEDCVESVDARQELTFRSSPISPEIAKANSQFTLHVCPYCGFPAASHEDIVAHLQHRCLRHPPGREIYRDTKSNLIMFEVDGKDQPVFAQNIALLSKMFLEHKALDYDMRPFVFYVLCEVQPQGCAIMGYFSKEKRTPDNYNLSCILTLPQFQGRGMGRFMVEVSYELTRRLRTTGTPERPLSDLGERTYNSFWQDCVVDALAKHEVLEGTPISVESIMRLTGMCQSDVQNVLTSLKLIDTRGARKSIHLTPQFLREHEKRQLKRLQRIGNGDTACVFDSHLLCWDATQYELVDNSITPQVPVVIADTYEDKLPKKRTRQ